MLGLVFFINCMEGVVTIVDLSHKVIRGLLDLLLQCSSQVCLDLCKVLIVSIECQVYLSALHVTQFFYQGGLDLGNLFLQNFIQLS